MDEIRKKDAATQTDTVQVKLRNGMLTRNDPAEQVLEIIQ